MTTTRNLKGKLARELDAIRARIRRQDMTAKELWEGREAAIRLASRANKVLEDEINGTDPDAFRNALDVLQAAYVTIGVIGCRITELEKATL